MKNLIIIIGTILLGIVIVNTLVLGDLWILEIQAETGEDNERTGGDYRNGHLGGIHI